VRQKVHHNIHAKEQTGSGLDLVENGARKVHICSID
jgi:hypothetical protein